ncbi:hypothetical protein PJL18_03924 [Paenarthrobacter nicotinovorans]|nr:hypothetical protein [Paenarthrobacter nicotinovorans]
MGVGHAVLCLHRVLVHVRNQDLVPDPRLGQEFGAGGGLGGKDQSGHAPQPNMILPHIPRASRGSSLTSCVLAVDPPSHPGLKYRTLPHWREASEGASVVISGDVRKG